MYEKIAGKKEEELIGCKKEDIFDKDICKMLNKSYLEAKETGKVTVSEVMTYKGYDNCTIIPIKNNEGNVTALVSIVGIEKDFSKLHEHEREIDFQKNLTRNITDILPGFVFCKSDTGEYIYANRECEKFYEECGIDSIIGKTEYEINKDLSQVEKSIAADNYVLETGETSFNETVIEYEGGRKIYREVVRAPLKDSYGNIHGIVGRSLDVTERKIYENNLKYLSYTDILTQAKNRTYFEHMDRKYTRQGNLPIGIIMGDSNGLKFINDTFGHKHGDLLLIETANAMKRACKGIGEVFRFGGDEFAVLIPNATEELCDEVIKCIERECEKFKNNFYNISISLGSSLKEDKSTDIYDALKSAEEEVYRQKLVKGDSFKKSLLDSLKLTIAARSEEKSEHNRRVVENALKIAEKLNMTTEELEELTLTAELHDVGIIGINEEIINKKGPLNKIEYEEMKTHSEKGFRIVKALSPLKNVAYNILYHHEKWDGSGYPMGLKGEQIPIVSRIISICDTFDIITNPRTYKEEKMTTEKALEEIKRCSGTQFDPKLAGIFVGLFKK